MTTARAETFADGVFAIAATLLVLDVRASGPDLGHDLLRIWPSYAAYAISFLTIGIMWVNHHVVFDLIDRVTRPFLFLNVGFLMLVAFVPFPARLVAENLRGEGARAAALTYGVLFVGIAVFYNLVWHYALRRKLLREDADPNLVAGITRSYYAGPVTYLAATLVALASPQASVAMYGAIGVFYVFESARFAKA